MRRQNAHPMSFPRSRVASTGFSAIELMVSIAIMLILTSVAAPSLRDFIMNVRLTGQANDLMTDLMLARSEATKRDVNISVCPLATGSTDTCAAGADWKSGWMVVVDADSNGVKDSGTSPLRQSDPITGSNSLKNSTTGVITFTATGVSATLASKTLTLCDPRGIGRSINVTPQGRTVVSKITGCTQS